MAGPVGYAEIVSEFDALLRVSQLQLYRLTATAANESDQTKIKIKINADNATATLSEMATKLEQIQTLRFATAKGAENIRKLISLVATYQKQAAVVIDMADSDAGTALTLMTSVARSFTEIDKLTDEVIDGGKEFRDRMIARNNQELTRQEIALVVVLLASVIVGGFVSLFISRGIEKPIIGIAATINHMAQGEFNLTMPHLGRKDEIGQIAEAVAMVLEKVGSTIGQYQIGGDRSCQCLRENLHQHHRLVAAHRAAGGQPGTDLGRDGRDLAYGEEECR
jgi:HAMP domain-containing protein